jgi:hypothetical protein
MDSDLTTEELRRRLEEAEVRLREKPQVEAALRESAENRTRFDTMAEGFCALEVLRRGASGRRTSSGAEPGFRATDGNEARPACWAAIV